MANEGQRKTFLSYSRVNKDFAIKLAKELKAEGFYVWLDQLDIPAGSRWDREVEKALKECEVFMIIMTPSSIDSENVLDEIGYAIDNGKRFLPVLLEKCDVPLRLRRFQYVDFTTKNFDEGVESAKDLLRSLIAQITIPRKENPVDPQNQMAQGEADRKAKEEAGRLAAQKAESDRIAKQKADDEQLVQAEAERKAREEADRLATQKAESERVAKQKADDERLVQSKAETERKAREEANRLAAQKAESERVAKQKADDERLAKARAKEEADQIPAQVPQWSAVAWITLGWVIGFLFIAYNFRDYYNNRGYTSLVDTFVGALGGAVIGVGIALTLKAQRTISNWKSMLWITLITAISFSIAVVKGEQSYRFATNGAIYGAIGWLGIAFVLRNIHVVSNWKNMAWITLFGAFGSAMGLGAIYSIFQAIYNSTISGIVGGVIGGSISAFGLIWQIRKGVNNNLLVESVAGKSAIVSTTTEQPVAGTKSQKAINDWLQIWWKRGLLVTVVMVVLGIMLFSLAYDGSLEWLQYSSDRNIVIVISIVVGVFGFMFYPHKISYIMTAVFSVLGAVIWFFVFQENSGALYVALWLGIGSGFVLSAIVSRILHAIKKI